MKDFVEAISKMPQGDIRLELEAVMGGWCGYVSYTPVSGAVVPAGLEWTSRRTLLCNTREEAAKEILEVLPKFADKLKNDAQSENQSPIVSE